VKTVSANRALRFAAMLVAVMKFVVPAHGQVPVIETNVLVRVMAANLTTSGQRYDAPGLRIFQGLKPDIVAIQEFNYTSTNGAGANTPAAMREMVNLAFGTNFHYFRESGAGYSIPNGVISRWPIAQSGSWVDVDAGVNDRGFAWAQIDLPGTNDVYLVSVHLKSGSSDTARRAAQAAQVRSLIQSNFPPQAWLVVAGDMNFYSRSTNSEPGLGVFLSFLSDDPIPDDGPAGSNPHTNRGRDRPYDMALPSLTLASNNVPVVIGTRTFTNGLVFDSRVYTPLAEVAPVQFADSDALEMQHMAVVKDFRVPFTQTNFAAVPAPRLAQSAPHVIRWTGPSNLAYTVQAAATLTNWVNAGAAISTTTNYAFTNTVPSARRFFRVRFP
jgi:hypothetical protein